MIIFQNQQVIIKELVKVRITLELPCQTQFIHILLSDNIGDKSWGVLNDDNSS